MLIGHPIESPSQKESAPPTRIPSRSGGAPSERGILRGPLSAGAGDITLRRAYLKIGSPTPLGGGGTSPPLRSARGSSCSTLRSVPESGDRGGRGLTLPPLSPDSGTELRAGISSALGRRAALTAEVPPEQSTL